MKSLKPIIISAAVIVALIVAYLLMVLVFPQETAEEPEATASASAATETRYIIDRSYDELDAMEFIPAEGESFRVDVIPPEDEDSNSTFKVTPATDIFDYNSSLLRSMTYTVTSISAKEFIEEDAADLSIYGLDEPFFTLRNYFSDGTVYEIYLGNQTPADSNYYCYTNQSNDVYTMGSYVVSLLTREEIDYRAITLFPVYEDDDIYEKYDWLRLTEKDGTVIEIYRDWENNMEGNVGNASYFMASPTIASGNDTVIQSKILDVIAPITTTDIVRDITEDEFEQYGFDHPVKLELRDVLGNELSLLIGDYYVTEDGEINQDYVYCMIEDHPTLLVCASSLFTFKDINYVELMIRTAWYHNIKEVDYIEYNIDGDEYLVDLIYTEEENEDGETETVLTATINGDELSDTNARRLFVRTLNFRVVSELAEDTKLGDPEITVAIHMHDEAVHTLELTPINARQYAATVDGVPEFYVYLKNVTTLRTAFQDILDGDELEFSFD